MCFRAGARCCRDGERAVVGPEETSRFKGRDIFDGAMRQILGLERDDQ